MSYSLHFTLRSILTESLDLTTGTKKHEWIDHIAKNKRRLGAFSVYSEDDFSICMPHVSCSATKLNH